MSVFSCLRIVLYTLTNKIFTYPQKRTALSGFNALNYQKIVSLKKETSDLKNNLKKKKQAIDSLEKEVEKQKEVVKRLKNVSESYRMLYHSGAKNEAVVEVVDWNTIVDGNMERLESNALECELSNKVLNDGTVCFVENLYQNGNKKFCGWTLRFKNVNTWFWYLEDGSICSDEEYKNNKKKKMKVYNPGDKIPVIPFSGVETIVCEAKWKKAGIFG